VNEPTTNKLRRMGSVHYLEDIPMSVRERVLLRSLKIPRIETIDEIEEVVLREDIRGAVGLGHELAQARACVRWINLPGSGAPSPLTGMLFDGPGVQRWLAGCTRATLMVVTIGEEIDETLEQLKTAQITDAFYLDAVASELVEAAVNAVDEDVDRAIRKAGFEPTRRRSPGYGGWTVGVQPEILRFCEAERIGVSCTPTYLMQPTKTVTAVIGWRETIEEEDPP